MHTTQSQSITQLTPADFPERLLEIPQPPEKLFMLGSLPSYEQKFLAIVGSRNASAYGKDVCTSLIQGLRGYPVVIVSGLAIGIDTCAHKAALEAGLPTLAFPGSGLDESVLYPAQNRNFAKQIIAQGGALISEYEPKEKSQQWMFPRRNRIMAGFSHAVLVIEASDRSGTLITARLAAEYNRDVLAVPGSIFSQNSFGPHMLIRNGATPICSSADLLDALGLQKEEVHQQELQLLSEREQKVCTLLSAPLPRDELIRALDIPTSEAQSLLMMMELKGFIKETLGEIRICIKI